MDKDARIYIAGHTGLLGSALVRTLESEEYTSLITATHDELELCDRSATRRFFRETQPEYVFFAAGRVGGIKPNMEQPAQFITDNILMQTHVLENAAHANVKKLVYFASCCAYPTECPQPIREEMWGTGKLEPTNEPFALAKLAGVGMCQAYRKQYGSRFISVVPANLFGPEDDFDPSTAHLVGQTMTLMHRAKEQGLTEIVLSGTGKPVRDFMYSDDAAEAAIFLMKSYDSPEVINIGTGQAITKRGIAEKIKEVVGYQGAIVFDTTKPDGMMHRELDISRLHSLGWSAKTPLEQGLRKTYDFYLNALSG